MAHLWAWPMVNMWLEAATTEGKWTPPPVVKVN